MISPYHTFCDSALPFGLQSTPKLFTAVADGLSWALQCEGIVNLIHYLDDFFFWSKESSPNCARALSTAVPLCHRLCLPVAPQKVATMIVFLGIVIDSARQEIRLPEEMLVWLHQELWAWGDIPNRSAEPCGKGGDAMPPILKVSDRHHEDPLQAGPEGPPQPRVSGGHRVVSCGLERGLFLPRRSPDALWSWGCGAFIRGSAEWLQLLWPASWLEIPIAAKELVPIVASLAVWGPVAQCKATVIIWQGSARDPLLNHLLWVLALLLVRGSKYSSMWTTSRGSGTVEPMRFRKIAPCYFSPSPKVFRSHTGVRLSRSTRLGGLLDILCPGSVLQLYGAGKRRYLRFCSRANLSPFLATEGTRCMFVAHLATEGLRAQSISGYLSVVQHMSIEASFAPLAREECPCLGFVLKGVSRGQAAAARPRRIPITPQILLSLKEVWEWGTMDTYTAWLLWAMVTIQDLSAPLAVEALDISFEGSPVMSHVHLRFSKTDATGSGQTSFWAPCAIPSVP